MVHRPHRAMRAATDLVLAIRHAVRRGLRRALRSWFPAHVARTPSHGTRARVVGVLRALAVVIPLACKLQKVYSWCVLAYSSVPAAEQVPPASEQDARGTRDGADAGDDTYTDTDGGHGTHTHVTAIATPAGWLATLVVMGTVRVAAMHSGQW